MKNLLAFVALTTMALFGCAADPIGATQRTQIRNDANTAQIQAAADAKVDIAEVEARALEVGAEQDRIARQTEAEQERISRQIEAEQQARSEIARANVEARARVSIHNSWASVTLLSLLALCTAILCGVWISNRDNPIQANTAPQIGVEAWGSLQLEAQRRGQRIELRGNTMLLIDSQTSAIVAQKEVNR